MVQTAPLWLGLSERQCGGTLWLVAIQHSVDNIKLWQSSYSKTVRATFHAFYTLKTSLVEITTVAAS
jgi:hypothetical protein